LILYPTLEPLEKLSPWEMRVLIKHLTLLVEDQALRNILRNTGRVL